MTTPEPPTTETPVPPPPPGAGRRSWGSRVRSRGFVIGAVIVALVVVGGVVAALLIPDRAHGGFGPGFGRGERVAEVGHRGPGHAGGPGRGHDGRGHDGHGGRGPFARGTSPVVAGTVVSAANGTLVVAVDGGAQRTLRTDAGTRVAGKGKNALGDLRVGERVVVAVQGTGDTATALVVRTPKARVTGTVTALTGNSATVVSIDGLTVTADVTALTQRPAVGDVVVLRGVAADGSTIRADGVRVLPRAS